MKNSFAKRNLRCFALLLLASALVSPALAQGTGQLATGQVWGNFGPFAGPAKPVYLAGIMPDGLGSPACVRDGNTNCTSGVVAASAAARAIGLPLRLAAGNGYCITPTQFGGSSPPAGMTLAALPYGIIAESPTAAITSCATSPTGNALVRIVNYSAGNTINQNFTMEPLLIDAGANNSYALELYGSMYSNVIATLRGGSVASYYVHADNTHVVTNNSWNISFDTRTSGISALMQTTDGATNGVAIAANRCVISNPFGTAAGDVVQTDYMNGGCSVDAESSNGGYGVNLGHTSNGVWNIYTEGNALGGVNGTANTKGVQISGSSQDGVSSTLKSCTTCSIDIWNLTSTTQERNFGDAVGQSVYVKGLPGTLTPSSGQGWFGAGATNGTQVSGNGSSGDFTVLNSLGATGCALVHNTATWGCGGYQINGAAPLNHIMVGDGTAYRDFATATGITTFWTTPSSANLRATLTDETGTGAAYFQGGDIGTPSAGVLTNATGLPIATGVSGLATGVAGFLATPSSANLRAALTDESGTGLAYFQGGALGTPSSGTLTSATGLPISTGVSGLGTGVATALGIAVGSAGGPVTFNGAGGTPSSITLTNGTGLPYSALPSLSANQLLGALTATTPSGQSVPSCSTAGSVLQWTSGTGFSCKTGVFSTSNAVLNAAPADPTGTTSTTRVMMGLGTTCTITPVNSTRIRFTITGQIGNNTAGSNVQYRLAYGTGVAPANGAALTGTTFGSAAPIISPGGSGSSYAYSFTPTGIGTGLIPGTAYWFDIQLGAVTTGTASILSLGCTAEEV